MTKSTKKSMITILFLFMYNFSLLCVAFAAEEVSPLQEDEQQRKLHRTTCSTSPADGINKNPSQHMTPHPYTVQYKLNIFLQSIPLIMSKMSALEAPLLKMVMRASREVSPFVLMALEQDRVGLKTNSKRGLVTPPKPQKKPQEVPKSVKRTISNYTFYEAHLKEEKQISETTKLLVLVELKGHLQQWLYRTLTSYENEKPQIESYRRLYSHFHNWFESLITQPVSIDHFTELRDHLKLFNTSRRDSTCDERILSLLNRLLIDSLQLRTRAFQEKFLPYYLDLKATYGVALSNLVEELTRENEILSHATEILSASQKKDSSSGLWGYFSSNSQPTTEINVAPIVQKHGHFPPYKQIVRLSPLHSQIRRDKIISPIIKLKRSHKVEEGASQTLEEDLERYLAPSTQQTYDQVRQDVLEEIQKPHLRKPRQKQKRLVFRREGSQTNKLQEAALLENGLESSASPSLSVVEPQVYVEDVLRSAQRLYESYEASALEYHVKGHEEDDVFGQCLRQIRRNIIFQYDENNVWQLSLRPNFDEKWIFIYSVDIFNKQFPEERNRFQTTLENYIAAIPILEGFFDQIFSLEVKRIIENAKRALLFSLECQYLSSGRPFPPPEDHPAIMEDLFNYHCNLTPGVAEAIQRQEDNVYIGDFPNSPTYETDRKILRSFIEGIFRKHVVDCLRKYDLTEEKVSFLKKVIAEKEANASKGHANYHNGVDTRITLQMPGTIRDEGTNRDGIL